MVEIREAVPNDAEAISELNYSQMGYRLSVEDTYERLCRILSSENDMDKTRAWRIGKSYL